MNLLIDLDRIGHIQMGFCDAASSHLSWRNLSFRWTGYEHIKLRSYSCCWQKEAEAFPCTPSMICTLCSM